MAEHPIVPGFLVSWDIDSNDGAVFQVWERDPNVGTVRLLREWWVPNALG